MNVLMRKGLLFMNMNDFKIGDRIKIIHKSKVEEYRCYNVGDILRITVLEPDCGECSTLEAKECPTNGEFSCHAIIITNANDSHIGVEISICGATFVKVDDNL